MLIGLVNKAPQSLRKKGESARVEVQETHSTEESSLKQPPKMVLMDTQENSNRNIGKQNIKTENVNLKNQFSNISNKKSALNMFLQEQKFLMNTGHVIDMGSQVLYIGIIGG